MKKTDSYVVKVARAVTRPIVTIIFAAVIADCVVNQIDPPTWFLSLSMSVIGFWFVDRGVHRWKHDE